MSLNRLPPRQFRIHDEEAWETKTAVIDGWGLPTHALTELNLNREGAVIEHPGKHAAFARRADVLKRFHTGFEWQDDDGGSRPWTPRGLTGNADSRDTEDDSKQWLAVSWHYAQNGAERAMRLSFIDVTAWHDPIRYRHVLLVNPIAADDSPSQHGSFEAIPTHAGGVVWFRDYLYVADSRGFDAGKPGGLLVFDMRRIKEVDPSHDDRVGWSPEAETYHALGYRYVLPQVGRYVQATDDNGERLRWSFIGLDRTGATRNLMMGEYTTSDQRPGRLVWWELDKGSGRLAVAGDGQLGASLARVCSSERSIQGCHSQEARAGGTVWLSRSSGHDALYERPVEGGNGATREPWADQPEGLTYAPRSDNLWCVTERAGARAVFAVKRRSL
jgi:hypothetical protein